MVLQQPDDDAGIELKLEDLFAPRHSVVQKKDSARLHNSMSALKIADEAPSFGATRLTGPARFNEVAVTSERRKRLASMRIQHCQEKSRENQFSKSFGCLDWESGDSDHSDGRGNGSFRGLFRKSSSSNKLWGSFSSLEADSNHNSSQDETKTKNQESVKADKSKKKQRRTGRSERTHKREMADKLMKNALNVDAMGIGPEEPKDKHKQKNNGTRKETEQGDPKDNQNALQQKCKKDPKVPRMSQAISMEHTKTRSRDTSLKPSFSDGGTQKSSSGKMVTNKSSSSKKKKKRSSNYLALDNDSSEGKASERRKHDPPKPPVRSLSPAPGDAKAAGPHSRRSLARTRSGGIAQTKATRRHTQSNDRSPLRRSLSDKPPARSSRKLMIGSNAPPLPRRISRKPSRRQCHSPLNGSSNQDGRPALLRSRSGDVVRGRPLLLRTRSGDIATSKRSVSSRNLLSKIDGGENGRKNASEEGARRPALGRSKSGEVASTKAVAPTRCLPLRTRSGHVGGMKRSSHLVSSKSLLPRDEKSEDRCKASKRTNTEEGAAPTRPALSRAKSGSLRAATTSMSNNAAFRRTKSGTASARFHHPLPDEDEFVCTDSTGNKKKDKTKSRRPALTRTKSGDVVPAHFSAIVNLTTRQPPPRSLPEEIKQKESNHAKPAMHCLLEKQSPSNWDIRVAKQQKSQLQQTQLPQISQHPESGLSCQPILTSPQAA